MFLRKNNNEVFQNEYELWMADKAAGMSDREAAQAQLKRKGCPPCDDFFDLIEEGDSLEFVDPVTHRFTYINSRVESYLGFCPKLCFEKSFVDLYRRDHVSLNSTFDWFKLAFFYPGNTVCKLTDERPQLVRENYGPNIYLWKPKWGICFRDEHNKRKIMAIITKVEKTMELIK